MTERRGVPPPPKAESERVAKLIGQQRRQVNQSDESLQKQNIFLVFILCYIFRSSNFFTVACLQCWNEHTQPMKSGGFLNHSDISLLWHTWPKRLVCFSLLIDCLLIISISLPFMCTIGCISITAVYNIYIKMLHVETMTFIMVLQKECRIFLKRITDLAIVSIWSAQLIVLIKWWKTWISLFCVKVRTRRSKHGYSTREQLFLFTVQSWLGGLLHISMNKIYVYHSYTIAMEYNFYHHVI